MYNLFNEKPCPTSPAVKPTPNEPNWHHLPNLEGRTSGTHSQTIWRPLLLPLGRQNIPDGCIIYHSIPNIKIPPPNSPPMSPTVSAPPDHRFWHCLHVFTSAPNPCSTAPPYYTPPPSHPAPSAYQPIHPLTPKDPITNSNQLWHHGKVLFLGGGEYLVWIYEVSWGIPGYSYMRVATTGEISPFTLSLPLLAAKPSITNYARTTTSHYQPQHKCMQAAAGRDQPTDDEKQTM
jgi:hypothetical protein